MHLFGNPYLKLWIVGTVISCAGCAFIPRQLDQEVPPVPGATRLIGKVIRIQDGDTLTVLDPDATQHRVRLSGIDAPEKGQPYGEASQANLTDLSAEKIISAVCPKVDQYQREICTVWVSDTDLSLAQIKAGLAWHYKRFQHEQSLEERKAYAEAEDRARAARIGLWQDDRPFPPWDWRRYPSLRSSH